VKEKAWNPAGTGPPAGVVAPEGDDVDDVPAGVVVDEEGVTEVVVVAPLVVVGIAVLCPPPLPQALRATSATTRAIAATRLPVLMTAFLQIRS
jgi:hypothetical protein